MRCIKSAILFLFLSLLIYGKAHALVSSNPVSKEGKNILIEEKISQNNADENTGLKRKIKPRGVEEAVPQISSLKFEQTCTYRAHRPSVVKNTYTSFLYCVDRKRGPPLK